MMLNREVIFQCLCGLVLIGLVLSAPVSKTQDKTTEEQPVEVTKTEEVDTAEDELKNLPQNSEQEPTSTDEVAEESSQKSEDNEVQKKSSVAVASLESLESQIPVRVDDGQGYPASNSQLLDDLVASVYMEPSTVAEYLLLTGDWTGFDEATIDMLKAGILRPDEVRQYREDVAWEYELLVKDLIDAETSYLDAITKPRYPPYNRQAAGLAQQLGLGSSSYPGDLVDESYLDLGQAMGPLEEERMLEDEVAREELIQAILNGYEDQPMAGDVDIPAENDVTSQEELRAIMDLVAVTMQEEEQQQLALEQEEQALEQEKALEDQQALEQAVEPVAVEDTPLEQAEPVVDEIEGDEQVVEQPQDVIVETGEPEEQGDAEEELAALSPQQLDAITSEEQGEVKPEQAQPVSNDVEKLEGKEDGYEAMR